MRDSYYFCFAIEKIFSGFPNLPDANLIDKVNSTINSSTNLLQQINISFKEFHLNHKRHHWFDILLIVSSSHGAAILSQHFLL